MSLHLTISLVYLDIHFHVPGQYYVDESYVYLSKLFLPPLTFSWAYLDIHFLCTRPVLCRWMYLVSSLRQMSVSCTDHSPQETGEYCTIEHLLLPLHKKQNIYHSDQTLLLKTVTGITNFYIVKVIDKFLNSETLSIVKRRIQNNLSFKSFNQIFITSVQAGFLLHLKENRVRVSQYT